MNPQAVKPRILVVDDNPANRVAFESLLEADYTVMVAESGHQALKLAMKEEFAVVLLDVRMPGLDGFETAELLRQREQFRHTPIIFMSAYDQNALQMKRGYVAGATDYLFSPVDEELLKFKVAAYSEIYLRNQAMRIQIQHLTNLVQTLQVEMNRRGPNEAVLKGQVKQLQEMVEELKRQIAPVPS